MKKIKKINKSLHRKIIIIIPYQLKVTLGSITV
jgi:hypothetical protein